MLFPNLTTNLNPLRANPTKWSNILKQFVGKFPANCLSLFDHFVKLALKGLIRVKSNEFQTWDANVAMLMDRRRNSRLHYLGWLCHDMLSLIHRSIFFVLPYRSHIDFQKQKLGGALLKSCSGKFRNNLLESNYAGVSF